MNTDHIAAYMQRVQNVYATGVTTEHSFRPALQFLFDGIIADVKCINEPKEVRDVGRPDFVFKRKVGENHITIGHCEAKDINKDVSPKGLRSYSKEQFTRYNKGLPNLIYTNGLDFRFYVKGELVREITIGDLLMGRIESRPDAFPVLAAQLTEFAQERLQTITSAKRLAELMAGKALLLKEALFQSLKLDPDLITELAGQYKAFKDQLIHDLTPEGFADIYAETIAYGLFAARLHDETLEDFSRQEALELLPKSNPFLRSLFSYVAGPMLEDTIRRDVDELAEIFQATDLQKLFADFGSFTKRNDPFIHFYETFLAEYNPKKRKARGVWYTPEPVVNFIVRAVDDVLKSEFGLPMGLADTSKITVDVETGQTKTTMRKNKAGRTVSTTKPVIEKREMHRVQILDPATGTGTFLAEVIKQIAPKIKDIAPGKWSRYVEQDLIPRIHGFELLMASYAMCHMKLDMMLSEMGYVPTDKAPRLSVYLTNSLEEGDKEVRDLFMAQWLSNEAKAANEVKRDKPIMCIIGNPPYSVSSSNKSDFIENLVADYKKNLNERNIQPLSDDYIKFIRLSQHMIEENGEGILGFITNNSFLDGRIHQQMRRSLKQTFDKINIIDLHGSTKKLELSPDGETDKNVFDIMQGVSIIIASKNRPKKNISETKCQISHRDLWGSRRTKYDSLFASSLLKSNSSKLESVEPYHFFIPKNFENEKDYQLGFRLNDLFKLNACGLVTARDALLVNFEIDGAEEILSSLKNSKFEEFKAKYPEIKNSRDWTIEGAIDDSDLAVVRPILYRPFDVRYLPYSENSKGVLSYPRGNIMRHMISNENISMQICKQLSTFDFQHVIATNLITDKCTVSLQTKEAGYQFPLYLYPEEGELDQTRRVNMDPKIRKAIEKAAMGVAVPASPVIPDKPRSGAEPEGRETRAQSHNRSKSLDLPGSPAEPRNDKIGTKPDEVAIFDYIYGVLHCPAYRETYAEFLKIDFPRVPYPSSPESFWDISAKGTALRRLHLMEDAAIGETPYTYIGDGDDIIEKPIFEGEESVEEKGIVYINKTQGFENVPRLAWEFYIGGYQPAQKWLKDRKGPSYNNKKGLSTKDIQHYQKIIKILSETDRIMKTIEMDLG